MKQLLATAFAALTLVVITPSIASANCAGPTVRHDSGEVTAGAELFVEGLWWGDNCYDTGPPPDGEGSLGKSLTGIEIFLVQDDLEVLVASGDADANYGFTVTVTVPSVLEPGKFSVVARSGVAEGWVDTTDPLALVASGVEVTTSVAPFDASDAVLEVAPRPPAEVDSTSNGSALWIVLVGIGCLVALIGAAVVARRGQR